MAPLHDGPALVQQNGHAMDEKDLHNGDVQLFWPTTFDVWAKTDTAAIPPASYAPQASLRHYALYMVAHYDGPS